MNEVRKVQPRSPALSVEPAIDGHEVAMNEGRDGVPSAREPVFTRMDAPLDEHGADMHDRVNAQETLGNDVGARSSYEVQSVTEKHEAPGGPTHQAGVLNRRENSPNRTQLTETGVPGKNKERNVTDLDLRRNKHAEGDAFDSQEGTIGRPLAPGEPSIARRSVPGIAGTEVPDDDRPRDVPRGAVSRPVPEPPLGP